MLYIKKLTIANDSNTSGEKKSVLRKDFSYYLGHQRTSEHICFPMSFCCLKLCDKLTAGKAIEKVWTYEIAFNDENSSIAQQFSN